jgi:hypothetical protein
MWGVGGVTRGGTGFLARAYITLLEADDTLHTLALQQQGQLSGPCALHGEAAGVSEECLLLLLWGRGHLKLQQAVGNSTEFGTGTHCIYWRCTCCTTKGAPLSAICTTSGRLGVQRGIS